MKILVTNDAETITVEVVPMDDPTAPPDEEGDPWFNARCRDPRCGWDAFVDEGTTHLIEADAINDACTHLDMHDRDLANDL